MDEQDVVMKVAVDNQESINLPENPFPGQPGYIEFRTAKIIAEVETYLKELAELNPNFRYSLRRVRVQKAQKPENFYGK